MKRIAGIKEYLEYNVEYELDLNFSSLLNEALDDIEITYSKHSKERIKERIGDEGLASIDVFINFVISKCKGSLLKNWYKTDYDEILIRIRVEKMFFGIVCCPFNFDEFGRPIKLKVLRIITLITKDKQIQSNASVRDKVIDIPGVFTRNDIPDFNFVDFQTMLKNMDNIDQKRRQEKADFDKIVTQKYNNRFV